MKFRMLLISSLIVSSSCSTQNQSSVKHVYGDDGRKKVDSNRYDDLVGYLEGKDLKCVAFVTGQAEVTTSAHCIDNVESLTFRLKNGEKNRIESLKNLDLRRDVAVLSTADQFKNQFEYADYQETSIQVLSFDISKNLVTTSGDCSVKAKLPNYAAYTYDCDTSFGDSGAPLVQNGKVVGIHLGSSKKLHANIGVAISATDSQPVAELSLTLERWPPRIKIPNPIKHLENVVNDAGRVISALSRGEWACVSANGVMVKEGMMCGGCLAGAAGTAGAVAGACAASCGTTAGALTVALLACK